MKRRSVAVLVAGVVMVAWLVGGVGAAYRSDWNYHPGDLSGANCVQKCLDTVWDLLHGTGTATNAALVVTGLASSYGYPVMVAHTNGGSQVYITQKGSISANAVTTSTNTFPVTFIETPIVLWRYNTENIPATNACTVASNAFTIGAVQTNGSYIAVGRIK